MSSRKEQPSIILDDSLSIVDVVDRQYNLQNSPNYRKKIWSHNAKQLYVPMFPETNFGNLRNSGITGLLSFAYSNHLNVKINPHDIWNLFLSQVAKMIAKYSEEFRHLFTDSDVKKLLAVPSGSEYIMPMGSLSEAVKLSVNFDSSIFFPEFSTHNDIIREMNQAIFCDIASPYYDYGMFLCGIRSIYVGGTRKDWEIMLENVIDIHRLLIGENDLVTSPTLLSDAVKFFTNNIEILQNFIRTFDVPANNIYWKNIFTQKNEGSGSDLYVNGWFFNLYFQPPGGKITNYSEDKAIVFYKNLDTKIDYAAVYGGFDYVCNDNVYELSYSKHYYQLVDKK